MPDTGCPAPASCGRSIPPRIPFAPKSARSGRHSSCSGSSRSARGRRYWCLTGLSAGATPELATLALLRARACELAGAHVRGVESSEAFLVGLFSLLDAMLNRTMTPAIQGLPLSAMASAALQGQPNALRSCARCRRQPCAWRLGSGGSRRRARGTVTRHAARGVHERAMLGAGCLPTGRLKAAPTSS